MANYMLKFHCKNIFVTKAKTILLSTWNICLFCSARWVFIVVFGVLPDWTLTFENCGRSGDFVDKVVSIKRLFAFHHRHGFHSLPTSQTFFSLRGSKTSQSPINCQLFWNFLGDAPPNFLYTKKNVTWNMFFWYVTYDSLIDIRKCFTRIELDPIKLVS